MAGVGLLIGLLAVVFALPWLLRRELPPLRGPHGVGTDRLVVSANEGQRDVPLQVWYPCAVGAGGERAPYVAQPERVGPALVELLGLPAIASPIAVRMLDLRTRSVWHCDPQGSHLPLVFFSHGLGGFEGQNTYLAEELASRGAVVLAVNHADSSFSVFPDGHLDFGFRRLKGRALTDEAKAQLVRERARDVERVMAAAEHGALKLGAIPLSTLADFSRTTIFGHSLGGATAIRVAEMDAHVRLAIDLDGVPYENEATVPLDRPIVVIQTDAVAPSDLRRSGRPPAAWEAYRRRRERSREVWGRRLTTWGRVIDVSGVQHLDFTDMPLLFPAARHLGLLGENGAALQRWLVQLLVTAMRPQADPHQLLPEDARGLGMSVSSLGLH